MYQDVDGKTALIPRIMPSFNTCRKRVAYDERGLRLSFGS